MTNNPPRPAIVPVYDNYQDDSQPRLHWYGEPGHDGAPWTQEAAMAATIRELTVHWTEERTPPGQADGYYLAMIGREAYYHACVRNWGNEADPIYGDGIMYHYMITPTGTIFQTTAETKRTWNAFTANAWNLAVCVMAGHGDTPTPAARTALTALLDWMVSRADLPGLTPTAQKVQVLDANGHIRLVPTYGTLTHDESLIRQERPPKGCCGIYVPAVKAWRTERGL